jgi:hypothetical protein
MLFTISVYAFNGRAEDILKRLESTLRRKRARLQEMEKRVRELYKERTGEEPKYVGVL